MRTDIKKDRKDLYLPGRTDFTEVDVPAITYLAIDGHGDPNTSPAYAIAIQALYAGAYAIRSALKKRTGDDFVVGPLEGLWTSADDSAFVARDKGGVGLDHDDPSTRRGLIAGHRRRSWTGRTQEARASHRRSQGAPTERGQVAADPPRGAPTTTRPPLWRVCTTRSCRASDSPGTGPTTRSTSATPGAWRRRR